MKDDNLKFDIKEDLTTMGNIAEELSDDELTNLGISLKTSVEIDNDSRKEWLSRNDKWMELVTQVMEEKTYPWAGASNIKFPLISTAAVQFHARAFPALLGNPQPVKGKVIGKDPKGLKAQRAGRVGTLMSYQVMEHMDEWVDDMDRLLFLVPIVGSLYKKTYYSQADKKPVSELINPRDLIINYDALDIGDARKTHRLHKYPNKIREMQLRGLYRSFDGDDTIEPSKSKNATKDEIEGKQNPGIADEYALQELYEIHCLLDMDGDGYKEPYIVTMRASDGAIYRIVANYEKEGVEQNEDGDIMAIKPIDYFTHYYFLPDPESKTHGLGFGQMVGPINEAVNTIINQLSDAGHLSNLQGGFLSRGVRIKGGAVKFRPGEWKTVNSTGDDLRKGVFPMPVREPSHVLFSLLGTLIDSGRDLASVQDMMVGKNPGQNQPYSTSIEVIEQGMKVFNGIYKRLYRSMTAEFKKIYKINRDFPDVELYENVLDIDGQDAEQAEQVFGKEKVLQFLSADFAAKDIDIIPSAEPDMIMEMKKVQRSMSLAQKLAAGMPLNVQEVTKRTLEAEGHEDIETLMTVPQRGPSFDQKIEMDRLALDKETANLEGRLKTIKTQAEVFALQMDGKLKLAKANNEDVNGLHTQFVQQQELQRKEFEAVTKRLEARSRAEATREAGKQTNGDAG